MAKEQEKKVGNTPAKRFMFNKENYILLGVSFGIIVLGYILMAGGGADPAQPDVFNEEAYSTMRIKVAPVIILAGFTLGIFAILRKPKD